MRVGSLDPGAKQWSSPWVSEEWLTSEEWWSRPNHSRPYPSYLHAAGVEVHAEPRRETMLLLVNGDAPCSLSARFV